MSNNNKFICVCYWFFSKKGKNILKLEKAVRSKPWCFSIKKLFFKKPIKFSGFGGDCAVLDKTWPRWIIYKAAGNCKLWWTTFFDVLISWRADLVSPSAPFCCRYSRLSKATAAHSPQKAAQLPTAKEREAKYGKEGSSQDVSLSL